MRGLGGRESEAMMEMEMECILWGCILVHCIGGVLVHKDFSIIDLDSKYPEYITRKQCTNIRRTGKAYLKTVPTRDILGSVRLSDVKN